MMKNKLPKLLQDVLDNNTFDVDIITKKLKLPWLKLNIKFDPPTNSDLEKLYTTDDWRKLWKFEDYSKNAYQIKQWNGKLMFGPKDFPRFLEESSKFSNYVADQDSKCKFYREKFTYGWYIDESHYIRSQISKIIPDNDLNIVNTYILPPEGYLFPHKDYPINDIGLAKIYVALKWKEGNVFGMYGCGNLPIEEGDVFLINNYTLPHWVYNGSKENRIVIDIGANLNSKVISKKIIEAFKNSLLTNNKNSL